MAISFADDLHGWALFPRQPATECDQAGVEIWRTSDGAATWELIASVADASHQGIDIAQCKENISFVDLKHGFVTAWDDNHRPTIYRTSDGGVTWSAGVLPDPPDFVSAAGGFNLRADWVKRFDTTLYLRYASDFNTDTPVGGPQLVFAGPMVGYAEGRGALQRTVDGGAHWVRIKTPGVFQPG